MIFVKLFFDLETRSYIDHSRKPKDLRMSIAVVMDEFKSTWVFDETQTNDLIRILVDADAVVGFNHKYFDLGVLSRYRSGWKVKKIRTIDIFDEIRRKTGFWASLANVSKATVKQDKLEVDPVKLYRAGKLHMAIEYCIKDVDLTRRVYFYGRDTGRVFYRDKTDARKSIEVNWS